MQVAISLWSPPIIKVNALANSVFLNANGL